MTIYKLHQIVITALEIGAVGTGGRHGEHEKPRKGQNMEINEKHALFRHVFKCKK
jgi:hypothetical protein